MIILPDDDPNGTTATETTPLKGQRAAATTIGEGGSTNAQGVPAPQPPPSYGEAVSSSGPGPRSPTSANGGETWVSTSARPLPSASILPQHYGPLPPPPDLRKRTLIRLLKAYAVAWFVLFLWSIFIGTGVQVTVGNFLHHHDRLGQSSTHSDWCYYLKDNIC